MNIYKIVLTGGPCAGKTTVVEKIKNLLNDAGYYVITIPETATSLIKNNIHPQGNLSHQKKFQEAVLQTQMNKENIADLYCQSLIDTNSELLKNKKGIIILHDRGIMDNRAYLSYQDYNALLSKYYINEFNTTNLYDLVIDLVSVATTNPELYFNDGIRYEKVEEATHLDEITSSAWLLHRNLITVKPTENIEDKILIVYNHIINYIEHNQIPKLDYIITDIDSPILSELNEDNSKKIKVFICHILDKAFSNKRLYVYIYNDKVSYIIKTNEFDYQPTTFEDFKYLINSKKLYKGNEFDVIHYIKDGNHYIIKEKNGHLYIYTQPENIKQLEEHLKKLKPKSLKRTKNFEKNN